MRNILCGLLSFFLIGIVQAGSGVELGFKFGQVADYNQPGLKLANEDIKNLDYFGGQFYVTKLPVVDMIVSADYCWQTQTINISDEKFDFRMRDMAIGLSIVLPVEISSLRLYAGGGVASHTLAFEYTRPTTLSLAANGVIIPETSTYFGYQLIAGIRTAPVMGSVGVFAEGRYDRSNAPGGEIEYKSISAGIFLALP